MPAHHKINPLASRQEMVLAQGLDILFVGKRPFPLGLYKNVLTEVRHFFIPVSFIEFDNLLQRMNRRPGSEVGKVGIQIRLELVKQYLKLRIIKLSLGGNVGRVDQYGSQFFYLFY